MHPKQSKNILEEINFGVNSRSINKIVEFVHKKHHAIHWHVQYNFFNYPNNGQVEPRSV